MVSCKRIASVRISITTIALSTIAAIITPFVLQNEIDHGEKNCNEEYYYGYQGDYRWHD
ncbi:MAG: hypothetical protein Q8S57_09885 [Methanoregula sp.]|nr:hypothetical protein [Methanoregula sp.]